MTDKEKKTDKNIEAFQQIDLEEIKKIEWGLTPVYGNFLLEGCMVTLYRHKHPAKVTMQVSGNLKTNFDLTWPVNQVTEQTELCWADQDNATEQAAECIAMLLIPRVTEMRLLRTYKGPGFDFHLGKISDNKFNIKARLEVSGIFKGGRGDITKRVNTKIKQVEKSDYTRLPAYISVTEFSKPQSKIVCKYEL